MEEVTKSGSQESGQKKKDIFWGLVALAIIVAGISYGVKSGQMHLVRTGDNSSSASAGNAIKNSSGATETDDQAIEAIIPVGGVELNISYGDLGSQLIKSGVIDFDKMSELYKKNNSPLTQEQIDMLVNGSDKNIVINRKNANFLLNFFWALGLANNNSILTEGAMVKYGGIEKAGNFASTGGWTLGKGNAMQYYSKFNIISLTLEQQKIVERVSANVFRPCCNNSTAFPDCNHGMAALAVIELMASRGTDEAEIYEALKYINSYWFSQAYYEISLLFKNKFNKSWEDVDAKEVLGKDYSSATGNQSVHKYLQDNGLIKFLPASGSGCGV